MALNPNLVEARNQLALVYNHVGALEEALQELERAVAIDPSNNLAQFRVGETYLFQGKYEQSLDALRSVPGDVNPALVGHQFGHFHHTAYYIACAYARMNRPEQAIKWLEAAADDGFPCYPLFERDANLDSLRQDARFVTFLARQKQQWESFKSIL